MASRRSIFVLLCVLSATAAAAQVPESIFDGIARRDVGPAIMGGRSPWTSLCTRTTRRSSISLRQAVGCSRRSMAARPLKTSSTRSQPCRSATSRSTRPIPTWSGSVRVKPTTARVPRGATASISRRTAARPGSTWGCASRSTSVASSIDPQDTDIVYVAALGRLWGANKERGVFKTTDGGVTWQHVLAINEGTGAVDVIMDPANPKMIYAAAYQRRRTGWGFNGGRTDSGIYKSVDAGRSWRKLTTGLPEGRHRPHRPRHLSQELQHRLRDRREQGWRGVSLGGQRRELDEDEQPQSAADVFQPDPRRSQRATAGLRQRHELHVSDDGGKTFRGDGSRACIRITTLLDQPENSRHIIDGNDGGTWVSQDRAKTWEHFNNYPIGQF